MAPGQALSSAPPQDPLPLQPLPSISTVLPSGASSIPNNNGVEVAHMQCDEQYKFIKMLGHGGTASVEMVKDRTTGSVYARKIIRNVYTRNAKEAERMLHREVQIMRRLEAHHHIVRVHATYIVKRKLAIILEPAANGGDLAAFLQECRDRPDHQVLGPVQELIVYEAFGCLAAGLAFMHKQTIRHKDIKPQNILIHGNSVMYTDFGLSYDFGNAGQSTTSGLVQGLTRRYCAPEVAEHSRRNTKSDIFSLGCVYLEMFSILPGVALTDELLEGPFYEKLRTLPDQGLPLDSGFDEELAIIKTMVQMSSADRPSALEVVAEFERLNDSYDMYFCYDCCAALGLADIRGKKRSELSPFDYHLPQLDFE
jgi:serine/threonine protein kinase